MQTLLIHNETAGAGQLATDQLRAALEASGLDVHHCTPKDPALDTHLLEPNDLVVLAGGDGTIARILAKLSPAKKALAIVPLGTANNIAQSLGILSAGNPGSGNEILTAWKNADIQRLDVGIATGPWGINRFVEAVGIGALAKTILQFKTEGVATADSIRLGREAFHHALARAEPLQSRVQVDGKQLPEDLLVAEIMNIRHAGSRLHLAPDADIDDRLFDVVTVSMEQREGMLAWIKQGSDQTAPPLTVTRGREIVIDWRGDHLRIDDYGPDKSPHSGAVTIAFAPEQLEILVPSIVDREPPPPRR